MTMNRNKPYFLLFASCFVVKGVKRSLICDTQRDDLFFIPNDFFDILSKSHQSKVEELYKTYDEESKLVLDEYFDFLEKNELGFYTEDLTLFPKISEKYDAPELITNAIIDLNKNSTYNLEKSIELIADLQCKFIQFRIYDELERNKLESLVEFVNSVDQIIAFEIILKSADYTNEIYLKKIVRDHPKIKTLIIHSKEKSKVVQLYSEKERGRMGNIIFTSTQIDSDLHCGVIDQMSAKSLNNIEAYIEGLHFNSCLNRKLGIDVNGNVKNCPSMSKSYGSIDHIKLNEVVKQEDFQKNWHITKDKITVCNVCEFRRVCSDCRAFTVDDNINGKPKKCSYDPYTTTWN